MAPQPLGGGRQEGRTRPGHGGGSGTRRDGGGRRERDQPPRRGGSGGRPRDADPARRGFTILVTNYCNMACGYCGQEHHRSAVESARLGRLAERVESTIIDPATREVEVTWFGGEPLLGLRLIRELSARFTAAAKRALKRKRSVKLTLVAGDARAAVTLRR